MHYSHFSVLVYQFLTAHLFPKIHSEYKYERSTKVIRYA